MKETYLDDILRAKRTELAARHAPAVPEGSALQDWLATLPPTRDFRASLQRSEQPRIIAEFKRASPARGAIAEHADVPTVVTGYQHAGAAAISVLTDARVMGSLNDLKTARASCTCPLLCKDFILEPSQLLQARLHGADAVLLIVAALPPPQLQPLIRTAESLGLAVLCEAHDAHEVDRALAAGAAIIGVNARNLHTFEIELDTPIALRARVPASRTYVAESGVADAEDVRRLLQAGVDAVLVGTALMSTVDPGEALLSLRQACQA